MERHGFINEETMTGAMNTPISSDVHTEPEMDASFYTYVDMMIQEGIEKHGISEQQFFTGGYTIEVLSIMNYKTQHTVQWKTMSTFLMRAQESKPLM
ncbi:hypothetical protein [Geomicrobium sp. JCM 19037]|uniref:hypothetical protein n=1 Tax=Geomicrobium sp. JCM 19037 TaxID=1460634 RepID=UPI001EE64FFF|nr:hypothetical protein [Geomicrobium sp. JCM 19037]